MKQESHFVVDILFVLALFGVFAISALAVVTIGADVYQHTVQDMSRNYDSRTAIAYISEKIRQTDCLLEDGSPSISLSSLSGQPALALTTDRDGEHLCTWLYYHDGYLKELYMREGADLGGDMLAAGEDILKLSSLEYEKLSDNLLSVSMTLPNGESRRLLLSVRCK